MFNVAIDAWVPVFAVVVDFGEVTLVIGWEMGFAEVFVEAGHIALVHEDLKCLKVRNKIRVV